MMTWPLIQRNKVDDSKVAVPVEACAASDNEVLASMANNVRALLLLVLTYCRLLTFHTASGAVVDPGISL